jgi:hypothetical protein
VLIDSFEGTSSGYNDKNRYQFTLSATVLTVENYKQAWQSQRKKASTIYKSIFLLRETEKCYPSGRELKLTGIIAGAGVAGAAYGTQNRGASFLYFFFCSLGCSTGGHTAITSSACACLF